MEASAEGAGACEAEAGVHPGPGALRERCMLSAGCSVLSAAVQLVLEAHHASGAVLRQFPLAAQEVASRAGALSITLQALAVRVEDDGSRGMFAATCKELCRDCWSALTR